MSGLTARWPENGRGAFIWSLTRERLQEFSLSSFFGGETQDWSSAVKVSLSLSLFLTVYLSLSLSFELPAGSKLFYALVVTGRFIRLEICTNQLSFTASCQCVRLSGLLWGAAWGRGGVREGGNRREKKMSSNRPETELHSSFSMPLRRHHWFSLMLSNTVQKMTCLLHQSSSLAYCLLNVRKSFKGECWTSGSAGSRWWAAIARAPHPVCVFERACDSGVVLSQWWVWLSPSLRCPSVRRGFLEFLGEGGGAQLLAEGDGRL